MKLKKITTKIILSVIPLIIGVIVKWQWTKMLLVYKIDVWKILIATLVIFIITWILRKKKVLEIEIKLKKPDYINYNIDDFRESALFNKDIFYKWNYSSSDWQVKK